MRNSTMQQGITAAVDHRMYLHSVGMHGPVVLCDPALWQAVQCTIWSICVPNVAPCNHVQET